MMEGRIKSNYLGARSEPERSRAEGWSECFQDLASWCLQPQDELPQPFPQDEFNFRVDGRTQDCTWDVSSPGELQSELWDTSDLPLPSPSLAIEEDHNMDSQCHLPSLKTVSSGKKLNHGYTIKESPIKSNGNLLLSQGSLRSADFSESRNLFTLLKSEEPFISSDAIATKLNSSSISPQVKTEKTDVEDLKTTSVRIKQEKPFCAEEESDLFKVPQMNETEKKERPKLKLNVSAAAAAASNNTYGLLDTPDVMKSLAEEAAGFDLLKFVNGDFDDPNFLNTDPSNLPVPVLEAVHNRADPVIIKSDHDYTEMRLESSNEGFIKLKTEPLSPLKQEAGKRQPTKRRSTASSDDYVFESDDSSDDSTDWLPTGSYRSGKGRRGGGGGRKKNQRSRVSKKPRKTSVDSDSGDPSVSGSDRYRELRDRNNEASRKSRLNRKQKEVERIQQAESLEQENLALKRKAESLEKLVEKMREVLMSIVQKKDSQIDRRRRKRPLKRTSSVRSGDYIFYADGVPVASGSARWIGKGEGDGGDADDDDDDGDDDCKSQLDGQHRMKRGLFTSLDSYLEYRQKNNLSCKKSRLNRKFREYELARELAHEETRNGELKKTIDNIENLKRSIKKKLNSFLLKTEPDI